MAESIEYRPEVNVYDRMGGYIAGDLEKGTLRRVGLSNLEKIKIIINASCQIINDSGFSHPIDQYSIVNRIFKPLEKIPNYDYLNPTAFVLGFLASREASEMMLDLSLIHI